ncbi:MAG: TetR/AcrR family transcriptional regulator [Pseudomonadota bacterium]
MGTESEARTRKEAHILACALQLMKEQGDAGLTMRQLAERAGMRLSNLQYYFKTKDDVLLAMAKSYFRQCVNELDELAEMDALAPGRERTARVVEAVLAHGLEISDLCRIFRELWAISTRNTMIHQELMHYYAELSSAVALAILGSEASDRKKARVGSLVLPFVEGYSITASALPLSYQEVTELMTDLLEGLIEGQRA